MGQAICMAESEPWCRCQYVCADLLCLQSDSLSPIEALICVFSLLISFDGLMTGYSYATGGRDIAGSWIGTLWLCSA